MYVLLKPFIALFLANVIWGIFFMGVFLYPIAIYEKCKWGDEKTLKKYEKFAHFVAEKSYPVCVILVFLKVFMK